MEGYKSRKKTMVRAIHRVSTFAYEISIKTTKKLAEGSFPL